MTAHSTHAIERIARVLAGERAHVDNGGTGPSAAAEVDARWPEYRAEAVAILKSLRDPPPEVAQAGAADVWTRGIAAALGEHHESDSETSGIEEVAQSARHFLRAPS